MDIGPQELVDERVRLAFEADGVVRLRNVFPTDVISRLAAVVDQEIAAHDSRKFAFAGTEGGRFTGSQDMWHKHELCRWVCTKSALPELAGRLLGSPKVNLFYDHLFVKEAGANFRTAWHNDIPYWPIEGRQVLSFWIAMDRVTEESGALVFSLGSHKWREALQPNAFAHEVKGANMEEELHALIGDETRELSLQTYPMEAGDVLAFDAMAYHCAGPNLSSDGLRRGYAVRYSGADVVYAPRPGVHKMMLHSVLEPGGPIDCDRYPVVYRTPKHAG